MQEVPQLSEDARKFAKAILAAKDDPMYGLMIGWFRAGAWYMDSIIGMVLALPDDDPGLAQILDSMMSGRLYENEVIARNILRHDMARGEVLAFIMGKVIQGESLVLHARALVHQNSALPPNPKPSATDFYAAVFRLVFLIFRWLPRLAWSQIKMRLTKESRR